ncbi:MAG: hypothetical protein J1E05_02955 [Eubacterium sp.]|nr:hypothetical protein [Eubacterium sp.]
MKHIRAILLLLVVAVLLGGCSFGSAQELIDPISPTGTNADIKDALESFCRDGYALKTPLTGDFNTSYIFYDLDLDNENEVIVFYQSASDPDRTDMAVMDRSGGSWSVVSSVEGEGKDVYSIEFCRLDKDDYQEIIVLWDTSVNSSTHMLTAYDVKLDNASIALSKIGKSMTVSNYIPVDIDNTGVNELLIFTVSGGLFPSAKATLYTVDKNGFSARSSTKLDAHIKGYTHIISENTDQGFCVFADAVQANKTQMLTELIIWSDYYGEIVAPYYSYSSGTTTRTARNSKLCSMDVDGDGYIEIPLDAPDITLPEQVEAVDWKQYRSSVLKHACYTLAVQRDGYQLLIPNKYFDKISVSYDEADSKLTVSDSKNNFVFSVMRLSRSSYDEDPALYKDSIELKSDLGYIYLAELGNDSDIKITAQDLKSMIKSYEGE